jgi:hypothetical protein
MAVANLTMLAEVTVSGGAVVSLSSGAISIVEGGSYLYEFSIIDTSSTNVLSYMNGNTNQAVYNLTQMSSVGTITYSNGNAHFINGDVTGRVISGSGLLSNDKSYQHMTQMALSERLTAGTNFAYFGGCYLDNAAGSTFTEMVFSTSGAGATIQDGSYLRIWEQIQSV